ncbi:hypothetical protein HGRIS_003079 [Hohenbuehelia grisea]|uniref:Uncharacterized protein n=1 Tax=Hohenbuehelia grisea TaxID=104357 RepID=A0ABR3JN94_9AGAR
MNYSFLVAICAALSLVGASPLGAPSTIPGLIGRELGLRAAPGCSVGSCGGQIPNNVVCCTGWACINASAGGTCFKFFGRDNKADESPELSKKDVRDI